MISSCTTRKMAEQDRGKEKGSGLSDWNHSYMIPGGRNVTWCVSDD
ncbi:RPL7L1 isoform 1 [Pongo abelii]|uniref:RPL7L1 isoform 1 n=1 Tax=Pongo abelii TaxID=9601 RepID=A0A2J8Y4D3_PONAB|nr:RPL7L1 isoform 1 [Pongo abelii]